jgi:hypothetical protein
MLRRGVDLDGLRRGVPALLCRDALYGLVRNDSWRSQGAISGSRVHMLEEAGHGGRRCAATPVGRTYVSNDCCACPNQGEQTYNRDGEENLHHLKDIKALIVRAPYSLTCRTEASSSSPSPNLPQPRYELGSS